MEEQDVGIFNERYIARIDRGSPVWVDQVRVRRDSLSNSRLFYGVVFWSQ
jgi:hypothetical protein